MCDILNQSSQTVNTVISNHDLGSWVDETKQDHIDDRVNLKIAEGVKKAVYLITSKFDVLLQQKVKLMI